MILIHSAFYDDRPHGDILASLRILSISDVNHKTKLFCYVWYPGVKYPHITEGKLFDIGWPHANHKDMHQYLPSNGFFMEYIISCQLPTKQIVPDFVSIVTDKTEESDVLVPVTVPIKPVYQIDFGVCAAASFGNFNTSTMVEWFELHKIFGVKEFNLYNVSMSGSMKKVLGYYTSANDLILHQMPPVIPRYGEVTGYLNTLPSLNHCFFSNMYRYKHVVIVDFDEFITPKKEMTYAQLVKEIQKTNKGKDTWVSYTFNNEYFFFDYPVDETQMKYLSVLRYRKRYKTNPFMFQPKSFINPKTCMIASNHYCVKQFKGERITGISPKLGTVHHYKKCGFPKNQPAYGKCPVYLNISISDDTMLGYQKTLEKNVNYVLGKLNYFG